MMRLELLEKVICAKSLCVPKCFLLVISEHSFITSSGMVLSRLSFLIMGKVDIQTTEI